MSPSILVVCRAILVALAFGAIYSSMRACVTVEETSIAHSAQLEELTR